jgi:hypothetical protein
MNHSILENYLTRHPSEIRLKELESIVKISKFKDDVQSFLNKSDHALAMSMMMRDDIKVLKHNGRISKKEYDEIDVELRRWLAVAFSPPMCEIRRVKFEESSGLLLEHVAHGESVHRIRSLSELKRRLSDGRRCYALIHRGMENQPAAFLHVALSDHLPHTIKYSS